MYTETHLRLTRKQLYELVWSKPMVEIAKTFKVSDRAMAKLCQRKQVPVPPRGYWARKVAGQKVMRPPLPAFVAKLPKPKAKKQESVPQKSDNSPKAKPRSIFLTNEKEVLENLKAFRRSISDLVQYIIQIESWTCDYSFGANQNFDPRPSDKGLSFIREERFKEYNHLEMKGFFLEPATFANKKAEASFIPAEWLTRAQREEIQRRDRERMPHSLGSLDKRGEGARMVVSLPADALNTVLQIVTADKVKFIKFSGTKMRYKQAEIFRYSLQGEIDDE